MCTLMQGDGHCSGRSHVEDCASKIGGQCRFDHGPRPNQFIFASGEDEILSFRSSGLGFPVIGRGYSVE